MLGWGLGIVGFLTGLYQWVFEADLTQRAGDLTQSDWVVGVALIDSFWRWTFYL